MDASQQRPRVSILFPDQYDEASRVLGRAFVDDPLIKAIIPAGVSVEERVRRMSGLFRVVLTGHRHDGQPVVGVMNEGRVAGAAVVEQLARPAGAMATVLQGLPQLPAMVRATGWSGLLRAVNLLDTLARNRPPEPHLYLNILGVDPALQRRHFGVAILDFLHEQAALRSDLAGVYLETATEANVAYYSHVGYRVLNEIYPLGVRVWRMMQDRGSG
jgi:ribosomal protein S18 acetylase RimI-like enzyme